MSVLLSGSAFIFAHPDPGVPKNAGPDPVTFLMRIRIQLKNFFKINYRYSMKIFLELKRQKRLLKVLNMELVLIYLHFFK